MFMSCPHCRDLVATDRETRLPPPHCPRCGGSLREDDGKDENGAAPTPKIEDTRAGTPSIATFLQAGKATQVDATADEPDLTTTSQTGAMVEDAEASDAQVQATTRYGTDNPDTTTDSITTTSPANAVNGEDGNGDPIAEIIEHADAAAAFDDTAASQPAVPATPPSTIPVATAVASATLAGDVPSFSRQTVTAATHPRTAKWQWVALALLALLLALQILIADRARLAADADWRPVITRLCGALGCDVPPWHQPGAFAMLSRDVRPIIGTPGGLHVQATFRNDAAWTQDWPLLQLSLSDADGRVVGMRAFTPAEYLGTSATQAGLAPGQSARIALQLHEPNPDVVAFSFDFR
jgi:hypothetical protein